MWAKSNVDIWSIWKSQWQLKALTLQSHTNTRTHSAAGSSHLSKCEQQYLHLAGGCGEGRLSGLLTFFLHWLWSGVWGVRSFFFLTPPPPLSVSLFFFLHSEYISIVVESVLYREHCKCLIRSWKQIYTSGSELQIHSQEDSKQITYIMFLGFTCKHIIQRC